jgi:uncharacterized membrane protein
MIVLRYLYVLALIVWLGGMIMLGAIVAPATFQVLQARDASGGRVQAGAVFGEILHRYHLVAYGTGTVLLLTLVALGVLGPRPRAFFTRMAIIIAMLVLTAYSGVPLTRHVQSVQSSVVGPISALPDADARKVEFNRLHRLSTTLMMINIVGGLLLVYWEASE